MANLPTYQSRYGNSWALIIGINAYKHASPLGYAANDATAIAELLEARFCFPKDNISLLLDDDATVDAIRSGFLAYHNEKRVRPDDRLIVFFAGHGHTITGKRGEVGYLVPADGHIDRLDSLIRWDELTRNTDLIPAKHIFFLMDACYVGLALLRKPSFGSMRFMRDMLQRYTRQVLTAGKANETVADGNGVRPDHSIFTAHLLDALEGGAATSDGIITANGVMAYVYDRVARDQYSHQTPHYGFVDGDGDFIFDTSPLNAAAGDDDKGTKGNEDVLINAAPEVVSAATPETSVSEIVKGLLSDPSKKIKLDDFVTHHVRRVLDAIDLRHFPAEGVNVTPEEFLSRIQKYEEAIKDLQQIAILLTQWGEGTQLTLLEKTFRRLAEADKGLSGLVVLLRLTWYPLMVLMYSAGITALAAGKYDALKIVLGTQVQTSFSDNGARLPVIVPIMSAMTDAHDNFKWLPGHERNYIPRSEYLFKFLQPTLEDALFLGRSYEPFFDEFEVLLALVYSDVTGRDWGPPGRFGWKQQRGYGESPFDQIVKKAKQEGPKWGPVRVGLFQGSTDRFVEISDKYRELLGKLPWF